MIKTNFHSFSSTYLRPSYPIDFEQSSRTAEAQTPSPYTTALTTGLASLLRTASPRATQPTVADGFVWLLKVLSNYSTRQVDGRPARVTSTASKDAAQRRTERLLLEVPEGLEAQARPASTH